LGAWKECFLVSQSLRPAKLVTLNPGQRPEDTSEARITLRDWPAGVMDEKWMNEVVLEEANSLTTMNLLTNMMIVKSFEERSNPENSSSLFDLRKVAQLTQAMQTTSGTEL